MNKLFQIGLIILVLFMAFSCSFNSMFYRPDTDDEDIELSCEQGFIAGKNGNKIHYMVKEPDSGQAKANILILHGNAGNLAGWSGIAPYLTKSGYRVFMIDYQGFGKSEGKPGHKAVLNDAQSSLDFLLEQPYAKDTKLILFGFSIGGQLAIALAAENQDKIDGLIVEGTFTSHNDIATALMPFFIKPLARILVHSPYKAKNLIRELKMPKLIVHSTEDGLIPYRMGETLFNNAVEPKSMWTINGEHLQGFELHEDEYIQRIDKLTEQIR